MAPNIVPPMRSRLIIETVKTLTRKNSIGNMGLSALDSTNQTRSQSVIAAATSATMGAESHSKVSPPQIVISSVVVIAPVSTAAPR